MQYVKLFLLMGMGFASFASASTDERAKFCPYGWHVKASCSAKKGAKNCPCEKDKHNPERVYPK